MCPTCPAGDMVAEKKCLHFWGQIATQVAKYVAEPILAPESRFRGIRWGNLHHFSRSIRSDRGGGKYFWGVNVTTLCATLFGLSNKPMCHPMCHPGCHPLLFAIELAWQEFDKHTIRGLHEEVRVG